MSNIQSAKSAVEAELANARGGMAHYTSRIAALEKALAEIVKVDAPSIEASAPSAKKKEKKAAAAVGAKAPKAVEKKPVDAAAPVKAQKAGKKSASTAKGAGGDLPSTGGDFWPNLVSDQPKSASELLQAAVDSFGFPVTNEQRKKISQRQTFAINSLVKSGKIKDSGSGRDRRFFK